MLLAGSAVMVWSGSKAGWLLAMALVLVVLFHSRITRRAKVALAVVLLLSGLAGFGLASLLIALMAQEVMEFPLIIFPSTYVYSGAVVVVAGIVSALIVRNRIDNLDLVAVLKSRE